MSGRVKVVEPLEPGVAFLFLREVLDWFVVEFAGLLPHADLRQVPLAMLWLGVDNVGEIVLKECVDASLVQVDWLSGDLRVDFQVELADPLAFERACGLLRKIVEVLK